MASVHRRSSGNYQVRWREGRANRSRTFKTRDEARRWQGMVERSEVATPRPGEVPTLMEYADAWLATRTDLAETTRVQYDRWLTFHIYPELAHTPVNELTGQRIQGWQDKRLAEGAGPAVLGKAQTLLSQILDKAVIEGLLAHNPVAPVKRPRYKKGTANPLSVAQVEGLRRWYLERDDLGSATLISVLAYIGLRPQDALALTWADDEGELLVNKKNVAGEIVPGSKTGEHQRWAYIPAPVRADLNEWRERIPDATLIFPNRDGNPWTAANYNNWRSRRQFKDGKPAKIKCFKLAVVETGLSESVKPYDLRHTAASLYALAGWNHLEIANQLGHSPEVSVRVYQHLLSRKVGARTSRLTVDEMIQQERDALVPRLFAEGQEIGSSQ